MWSLILRLVGSRIGKGVLLSVVMLLAGHFGVKYISDIASRVYGHDQAVTERDAAIKANENLIKQNEKLNARLESDREKDKELRKEFYAREYEEINRYKKRLEEVEALRDWHNTPIPDDAKRMRERKGTVHSQQHIPEVSD